jgi:hypothetical protein
MGRSAIRRCPRGWVRIGLSPQICLPPGLLLPQYFAFTISMATQLPKSQEVSRLVDSATCYVGLSR